MSGTRLGKQLGIVTVLVVAACQAAITAQTGTTEWAHLRDPTSALDVFLVIAIAGLLPGAAIGGFLGWTAAQLDHGHAMRFCVLAIQAMFAVFALGGLATWPALILPAWIPTLAACAHLERKTRPPAPMPVAVLP
jgi:hypothetical protein